MSDEDLIKKYKILHDHIEAIRRSDKWWRLAKAVNDPDYMMLEPQLSLVIDELRRRGLME